jgi:hypothetical protein
MPRRLIFPALVLLASLLGPDPAAAWGEKGHRIVGELAQRQLTAPARAELARLLAGEPEPTLAGVAYWADDLRKHDALRGPRTERWHFVNLPDDCTYDAARDCPDGNCVVAAIPAQYAVLADRAQPNAARREALEFLVHLVADVHQPLHAGHRRDLGGNRFQVNLDGEGTNLHQVWDVHVLRVRHGDAAAQAQALSALSAPPLPPLPPLAPAVPGDVPRWAAESCALVQSPGFYPEKPGTLPAGYLSGHQAVAERRLREAAGRLADLLNRALAPTPVQEARNP